MLKRTFTLNAPYNVVIYTRMSSDKQNPRSPEQQEETIRQLIQRLKLPWKVIKVYTDAAISGRYFRRRNQLQEMLRAIRTRRIVVDLILVDTFERFGRADESAAMRQELHTNHGVLILTANSNFSDPTTTSGELLSTFEQVRAKDANKVKAHDVLRGKRDTVKAKHWPGGSPPFGYRLDSVMKLEKGRQVLDYSVLKPDEATSWIIRALFQRAADTAEGCLRLTRWFNNHPDIPCGFKPISEQTINRWLKSEIYKGLMIWERLSVDIVQDRRVTERNDEDQHIVVEEFCEPLVVPEVWDAVNAVRAGRTACRVASKKPDADGKLIAPLAGGVAVKNILSGLVTCGCCGLAMVIASSGPYTTKGTGEEKRYQTYKCPRSRTGGCGNTVSVPIEWLNEAVVRLLRERLFTPHP